MDEARRTNPIIREGSGAAKRINRISGAACRSEIAAISGIKVSPNPAATNRVNVAKDDAPMLICACPRPCPQTSSA